MSMLLYWARVLIMNPWVVSLLLASSLLSCSLEGDQKSVPNVAVSKRFPSMTQGYQTLQELPDYRWWLQLHDAQLNRLVDCGLKHNPDIQIALANLKQAQGELTQVKLSWIPLVNLYGGYSTNPALGIPGGFYGAWPYYALNLMQQLAQQKKSQYQVLYHRAAVDGARLVLIGQVVAAYFTLIAEQEQLRLLKRLQTDVKELVMLGRKNIQIGLRNEIDLAQLLVTEQLITAQMKPVKHNIVVSQNALRYLVNENPGGVQSGASFETINLSQFKPGSLPATVLCNRPDLKMAEYAVKRAHTGISVALSDWFPRLQLDNFIGEAHLPDSTFEQATDAYLQQTLALSTLGKVRARKGAYEASVAAYVKTVRRILRDVDNDFSANQQANEQYQASLNAEQAYRQKYQLQKGLLNIGLISYQDLLDSRVHLDHLTLTRNQAKLKLAMSLVMLYQDLAGGYAA